MPKKAEPQQPDMFAGTVGPPTPVVQAAADAWNEYAARFKWRKCNVLDKARRATIARSVGDYGGLAGWRAALEKVSKDRHVQGLVPPAPGSKFRQFKAHIDWFCQAKTIRQVGDEFYEDEGADRLVASGKKDGPVETELEKWGRWLKTYKPGRFWPSSQGERPESPHCRAPAGPLQYWREQNGVTVAAPANRTEQTKADRLRTTIAALRTAQQYDRANAREEELAALEKRPPVLVPAPSVAREGMPEKAPVPPRKPPTVTDVVPDWTAEEVPMTAYGEME